MTEWDPLVTIHYSGEGECVFSEHREKDHVFRIDYTFPDGRKTHRTVVF